MLNEYRFLKNDKVMKRFITYFLAAIFGLNNILMCWKKNSFVKNNIDERKVNARIDKTRSTWRD